MDKKGANADVATELEFNSIMFERKLTGLKDSQDSINACCHWCLNNRQHHKKIVSCWLNVLKRVKIENRLTLFYLANDVIQYSKRRNYDFVESWGTTLQKATTMVRDEKVKHKILRIFKIWEQRGVYGEEFLTDLCGLISASPSTRKGDETHEFQSAYLIQKIRTCSRLEVDTDLKLKQLKEHNPKIQIDSDSLISSLKDRAHVDDVEKEIDDYAKQMENYINALKMEIKARINLISLLTQAETQLENDKKDVKLVTTAYKTFATRVKALKKKLDEKIPTLSSPIPSPDINAPSPSPDSDIELLGTDSLSLPSLPTDTVLFTNPGYYNPVPPPNQETNSSFSNNFSSFMDSNSSSTIQSFSSNLFGNNQDGKGNSQTTNTYNLNDTITSLFPSMACPPPPPVVGTPLNTPGDYQYSNDNNMRHVPLMPPPMPPFSKSDDSYAVPAYNDSYNNNNGQTNYGSIQQYQGYEPVTTPTTNFQPPSFDTSFPPPAFQNSSSHPTNYSPARIPLPNAYPVAEEYNPEEELDTWAPEPSWEEPPPVEMDTPESPPLFEKEGYGDPVEYHDGNAFVGTQDVDHRVLPTLGNENSHRTKDIDHRNLISLTGSPSDTKPSWVAQGDQDYRKPLAMKPTNLDQDYRIAFDLANFKLPPPPPPPPKMLELNLSNKSPVKNALTKHGISPRKLQDNIESIDMDLSDDDHELTISREEILDQNLATMRNPSPLPTPNCFSLPPPFPDLLDDMDANKFLDNINEDFDLEELVAEEEFDPTPVKPGLLGNAPPQFFPMEFGNNQEFVFQNTNMEQEWLDDGGFQEFPNRDFPYLGRGNNIRGNINNRGMRGNRGGFRGGNVNEFRGRIGHRGMFHNNRGNGATKPFRGNNYQGDFRGSWVRRPQGGRNRGFIGGRGRGRGNFRGLNFRGGNF